MSLPQEAKLRTTAVVLAGGTGQRVGLSIPKQLLKIAGKAVIEHTLTIFQNAEDIDDIIVMMAPGFVPDVEKIVVKAQLTKVTRVIEGGATRNETTERAIAALGEGLAENEDRNVLFHDAVRPLLSQRVIKDCVAALDRYQAVDVAIPSADTIIVTRTHGEDGEFITEVPDRSRLRRGQTPQAFKLSTIRKAYRIAAGDPNFQATDDCSVVLKYLPDVPIHVVAGDEYNMKVTQPVDVFLTDKLFQLASTAAPRQAGEAAYRELLSGKTVVVFGGSYGIGADLATMAESYGAKVYALGRSTTGTHVENRADIDGALARAHAETGRVDYVINTAGVLRIGKLAETDDATIQEALNVNYLAPVQIARASYKYLAETQGQLLLYTSSSYTRGRAEYSLYSSTKAAMVNLTQALADEWAGEGIRVNCVNPERTATPMRTRAFGQEPEGSLLSSEAVARTSLDVLLSELTGHVIDVRQQDPTAEASASSGFDQALASALDRQGDG
ncbi:MULTISPECIES: bifunctional cytidylyltransferase/SDR family oxidoreductase [Streptomyces]|uniref:bifunctional cytidylyltransferase/SDR family oxidoreductase n=1 Tax=Streptomyces TaxID=1883 RepID=UPI0006AD5C83|nr:MULTISPECIES: bifunctional cytidylyltransferase/SDR family oxidoreductase [Streptomyces]ALC29978.1 2-C-methyl-D-erythritol 4-phosphate cytidylyltransferase [Streptomyces sp. CFMR 7]MBT3073701.1 bifunctional cytidylyltransferase/SDR family oxidoreductase [Streptomyces sp. COG21]MBT3083613.1 bifunctional cytidylyltransferase/SDR family oxidoreductase [Streptomyces sp. COG20]MBT3086197.1 bifunctional cytidylyltransferase/SDR family oxidoreductase [Streptomyces sp. CYG21]MBT3100093.1 bifunction